MRVFGVLFLFLLFNGTAVFVYLGYTSKGDTVINPGAVSSTNAMILTVKRSRKLKDNADPPSSDLDDAGRVSLQDYRPIDPVPNSKASIRPGPIQHGTPLMPYIPKPSPSPPPTQPQQHG